MPFPTCDEDATEDVFRDECAEETKLVGGVLMSPVSEAGGRLDFVHSVYKSTSVPFVGKYIGFVRDKTAAGDTPPPALVVVATTTGLRHRRLPYDDEVARPHCKILCRKWKMKVRV